VKTSSLSAAVECGLLTRASRISLSAPIDPRAPPRTILEQVNQSRMPAAQPAAQVAAEEVAYRCCNLLPILFVRAALRCRSTRRRSTASPFPQYTGVNLRQGFFRAFTLFAGYGRDGSWWRSCWSLTHNSKLIRILNSYLRGWKQAWRIQDNTIFSERSLSSQDVRSVCDCYVLDLPFDRAEDIFRCRQCQ